VPRERGLSTQSNKNFRRLIRGKIHQEIDAELLLFTPDPPGGVLLADSAVTTAVVENHGPAPV
jgi:hypothetical protein